MCKVKASVIIPTHNRHDRLLETLSYLKAQRLDPREYEIIVVDDGSTPPVVIQEADAGPTIRLQRTEGVERSAARNRGARIAAGEILIFTDDDITVDGDFVAMHLQAQREWPGALAVGAVSLPAESMTKPFARFRQRLEQQNVPRARGLTPSGNLCTAANMSIPRDSFQKLGGFDGSIASSEDQDLALRHTRRGGQIVFLPEAMGVHRDEALDIRSYCRRAEWGSLHMRPFCDRYPDIPDNVERARVNGPVRWGSEAVWQSARKLIKRGLSLNPIVELLFGAAYLLEGFAPDSRLLDRVYRVLLGAHIFRGYRKGLRQSPIGDQDSGLRPDLAADSYVQADR